jgi:hypothetical protein
MSFFDGLGDFINNTSDSLGSLAKNISSAVQGTPTVPVPGTKQNPSNATTRPDLSTQGQTQAKTTNWLAIGLGAAAVLLVTFLIMGRK